MIDKLTTLLPQAFKRLSRTPGYTALSAIGLILSLSGTLIIARYLHQEWTVDHWMSDREQIAFAQIEEYESEEPDAQKGAMAAPKAMEGRQPINEMEGVEAATEVWLRSLLSVKLEDEETFTVCAITADSDFVKVFPLQAVEGTLDLRAGSDGEPLLEDGQVLMEIKIPDAAPLWLARMLSELKLFPTNFSKYGVCYKEHILDDYIKEVVFHV